MSATSWTVQQEPCHRVFGCFPSLPVRLVFELFRFVRADRNRRGHRRVREVVEATGARAFLSQAEAGADQGGFDITDVVKEEPLESEVVGRACAGERLPKHAVLGLVPGGLGRVARELRVPRLRKRRNADQIRIDEERLAPGDSLANRGQVERIVRAAEEAVRNPEALRAWVEVLADEVPVIKLGCVDGVEGERHFAWDFGMQARAGPQVWPG